MAGLKLTLDEFLSQEETKPYREYACGEVYEKPMPNRSHSVIQRLLLVALTNFLEGRFLGEVFPELRCIFGPVGSERAYVPDLCFIRQARLAFDGFFMAFRISQSKSFRPTIISHVSCRRSSRIFSTALSSYG
jgi:Uma2 family endonuclease